MTEPNVEDSGDFVRVATCATPTEAHLLKGMLASNGISAFVADGNIVQANPWMTQALGGVRVLVRASQAAEATQAIEAFNAGAYQLEHEEEARVVHAEQAAAVFSPDRAALMGLALTPLFPAAIQIANARILGPDARRVGPWLWLLFLMAASAAGVFFMHQLNPGPFVFFRASFALWTLTIFWYFVAGQKQSRMLIASYGLRYRQRSLWALSFSVAVAMLALGWALSELA